MKKIILGILALTLISCQNAVISTQPSSNSTSAVTPTVSASPLTTVVYTREDYIRMFECVLAMPKIAPEQRGRTAAHLALTKNDMLWAMHGKADSNQRITYNETVNTIAIPLGCK